MSIRDYNKVFYITNGTTNKIKCSIREKDFFDDEIVSLNVTLGEFQLLKYARDILLDGSDLIVSTGYKE